MITCHEDSSSISLCLSRPFFLCVAFISSWLSSGAKMAKEVLVCESSLLTIFQKTHTHSICHEAQRWSVCISLDQTVIKDPEMRFSWIIWVSPILSQGSLKGKEGGRRESQRKRCCWLSRQRKRAINQGMQVAPGRREDKETDSPRASREECSPAHTLRSEVYTRLLTS